MGRGGGGRGDWAGGQSMYGGGGDGGAGNAPAGNGRRWAPKGSGDGASKGGKSKVGGGKTPWSFVHMCDDSDSLGLLALSKQIPDDWIDKQHGGRRSRDRMHSTLLLKMTEPVHLQRLERLVQTTSPVRVEISELFCEPVDRIQDAEVYCIGVALASPGLRALKDAWTAEEPEDRRKVHVPYDSEGHISLAYIRAEFKQQAQAFVQQHATALKGGRGLIVDHISYQDEQGQERQLALGGGGGAPGGGSSGSRAKCVPGGRVTLKDIDGSVLEGGGQILRMSGGYSALLGIPLRISKIRAGRSKPGLAAQHLESLRLVRDVSGGSLTDDCIGSCEVTLQPGPLAPGGFYADPGTAGSITLMIQASLPPLLFAGGASEANLKGGTDVSFSPPFDFCQRVLLPSLKRMGADCSVDCLRRGVFPQGGGHVRFTTPGLREPLRPIDLSVQGEPSRIEAVLHVTSPLGADEQPALDAVRAQLRADLPGAQVRCIVENGVSGKFWVDIVVETTSGALFHGGTEPKDLPGFGKSRGGKGKAGGKVGSVPDLCAAAAGEAAAAVQGHLDTGAAVDEHLADQLILPASLADGTSYLLCGELSLHLRTAMYIAEQFLPGVKFKEERRGKLSLIEVQGVGHQPSGSDRSASAPVALPRAPSALAAAAPAAATPKAPSAPAVAAPAAAAHSRADEEIINLVAGTLSRATSEMLRDFRNDMSELAGWVGAQVAVEAATDRLVVSGGQRQRADAQAELSKVLSWYFGPSYAR